MSDCCKHFTRPTPIAWFFFLLGFGMTVAFGTWQVERLQWKQGLIAALAAANAEAPLSQLPSDADALKPLQFRKVQLRGSWLGDIEFHVTPRYLRDQFGYAIVTPLKLADGRIVLINRGWVPAAKKLASTRPESRVHGKATVTGLVRIDRDRSYFTPADQPERNLWFARDIEAMAAYAKLDDVVPAMVDAITPPPVGGRLGGGHYGAPSQTTPPPQPSPYGGGSVGAASTPATAATSGEKTSVAKLPIPSDGTIRLRNDHLSYIVTWYGIALGILVIFVTYHRKKD